MVNTHLFSGNEGGDWNPESNKDMKAFVNTIKKLLNINDEKNPYYSFKKIDWERDNNDESESTAYTQEDVKPPEIHYKKQAQAFLKFEKQKDIIIKLNYLC